MPMVDRRGVWRRRQAGRGKAGPDSPKSCESHRAAGWRPESGAGRHIGSTRAHRSGTPLQTWNATFVFDGDAERPRLTAVVFDQWEW
jgi:hypothetical protein